MEVRHEDDGLDELETNIKARTKLPPEVVKSYRRAMQFIRDATGEPTLRARKGWHFEKYDELPGEYSIRLNDQWRLFFRFEGEGASRTFIPVAIRDQH
ncbi:MAG: type II toxin-antitoxin system RelE/ParE family toxin [Dehalococcoidia bacterium]|nr:type II toxin-antitoxin system RelE/ParE family toxin [Dehalococcoidia bacterium]